MLGITLNYAAKKMSAIDKTQYGMPRNGRCVRRIRGDTALSIANRRAIKFSNIRKKSQVAAGVAGCSDEKVHTIYTTLFRQEFLRDHLFLSICIQNKRH